MNEQVAAIIAKLELNEREASGAATHARSRLRWNEARRALKDARDAVAGGQSIAAAAPQGRKLLS